MFCEQYVTVADLGRRFACANPFDFLSICNVLFLIVRWQNGDFDVFHFAERNLAFWGQLDLD